MGKASEILSGYQTALRRMGVDPEPLTLQAEALASTLDSEFEQALKAFHTSADQHPYTDDSDYGALLLETLGDSCGDPQLKAKLYHQAKLRAAIFTSYASSGGKAWRAQLTSSASHESLMASAEEVIAIDKLRLQ
jgi:hypothetical protein